MGPAGNRGRTSVNAVSNFSRRESLLCLLVLILPNGPAGGGIPGLLLVVLGRTCWVWRLSWGGGSSSSSSLPALPYRCRANLRGRPVLSGRRTPLKHLDLFTDIYRWSLGLSAEIGIISSRTGLLYYRLAIPIYRRPRYLLNVSLLLRPYLAH